MVQVTKYAFKCHWFGLVKYNKSQVPFDSWLCDLLVTNATEIAQCNKC